MSRRHSSRHLRYPLQNMSTPTPKQEVITCTINDETYALATTDALKNTQVTALIVALGSNYQADENLTTARSKLVALAVDTKWSTAFINPDYTATPDNPKPDYTNQCGYLQLRQTYTLASLIAIGKQIEQDCLRVKKKTKEDKDSTQVSASRVSMDIDILAVQLAIPNSYDDSILSQWTIIAQRYPFKEHELIGIVELLTQSR